MIFNFNVGILGHVDSGKTSLAKKLSTTASTAAFDKNPQSQERGITLDLGFSSFSIDTPSTLVQKDPKFSEYSKIQFTLVDCPGHASLIKTVIGGAQIIDLVLLVIDCQKGIQTQTAECLILSEIVCPKHLMVVLNKVDLFENDQRQNLIEKISRKLRKTLESTIFKNAPIVPFSCLDSDNTPSIIDAIVDQVYFPERSGIDDAFLFAVDHCFGIKGQGTIMTGTIISGTAKINDQVEIPSMKEVKKIKSMQIFRQPKEKASQGDRVAICVAQFDAKTFERGIVCRPGLLQQTSAALAIVNKIPYFKSRIASKSKFHISIGYETVLAKCLFFTPEKIRPDYDGQVFDFNADYAYLEDIYGDENVFNKLCDKWHASSFKGSHFSELIHPDKASESNEKENLPKFCLFEFDHPILCPPECLYIASKLDITNTSLCRLAFHGRILRCFTSSTTSSEKQQQNNDQMIKNLKIFKIKTRQGYVERMVDDFTVIANGLFKKQTNFDAFVNLKVELSTGEIGYIESHFGQSGKAKIRLNGAGLLPETVEILKLKSDSKNKKKNESTLSKDNIESIKVELSFKRYIHDTKKRMIQ